jgi:hypothetical protein
MAGKIALADVERLSQMANSNRPLMALPARRQIIEWARAPDDFETEAAFKRASELAAGFCRARTTLPEAPQMPGLGARRVAALAAGHLA